MNKATLVISPNVVNNSFYSLNNVDNYKEKIEASLDELIKKQTALLVEYILFISENSKIKAISCNKFILIRGLETVSHVFHMILYYTKNIDLAFYHSQKAFYFYVEFIEQITDVKHMFLNLNSRDASLFVYKKTIFDVNNEYRKNMIENYDKETMDYLVLYSNSIKHILLHFFQKKEFIFNKDYLQNIIEKIEHLFSNKKLSTSIIPFIDDVNTNDLFASLETFMHNSS